MSKQMNEQQNDDQLNALFQARKRRHASPTDIEETLASKLSQGSKKPWWKVELKQYFQISAVAMSCAVAFIVVNSQLQVTSSGTTGQDHEIVALAPQPYEQDAFTSSRALPAEKSVQSEIAQMESEALSEQGVFAERLSAASDSATATSEYANIVYHMLDDEDRLSSESVSALNRKRILPENEMKRALANQQLARAQASEERKVKYKEAQSSYLAKQKSGDIHQQAYARVVQSDTGLDLLTCDLELLKISQEVLNLLSKPKHSAPFDFIDGQLVSLSFDDTGHIIKLVKEKEETQC